MSDTGEPTFGLDFVMSEDNTDALKIAIASLLEINRFDLTYYLFGEVRNYWPEDTNCPPVRKMYLHWDWQKNKINSSGDHCHCYEQFKIPTEWKIPSAVRETYSPAYSNSGARVVRNSTITLSHNSLLPAPCLTDLALIEKAMRIALSATDQPYTCNACMENFDTQGLKDSLTKDITKEAG